jgi:hypothetical protein
MLKQNFHDTGCRQLFEVTTVHIVHNVLDIQNMVSANMLAILAIACQMNSYKQRERNSIF